MIKEGREDVGKLAADETKDAVTQLFILPTIGIFLWLLLTFFLGFTELLWGPFAFFKFVFFVSFIGAILLFRFIAKLLKAIHLGTRTVVNKTKDTIKDAKFTVEK